MKCFRFFLVALALICTNMVWAQDDTPLTQNNSGSTIDISTTYLNLTDNGGLTGVYSTTDAYDHFVVLTAQCSGDNVMRLLLATAVIDPHDTLFLYDGNSVNAPILCVVNNNNTTAVGQYFYPSALNTTGCITVRFKCAGAAGGSEGGDGFSLLCQCALPCVTIAPSLQTHYYKARNGVIYDSTMTIGERFMVDTLWTVVVDDSVDPPLRDTTGFDTIHTMFTGLYICLGDSLILKGRGEYGTGIYSPNDRTTTFTWNWGDGDTLSFGGMVYGGHKYRDVGCFDVSLRLTDYIGCQSSSMAQARVLISPNPIKTIFPLPNLCNVDSFLVNVGYEGDDATLTFQHISFSRTASKTNPVRTFIPDGPRCPELGTCYVAPVMFNEFPTGRAVVSKDDICSVCVEMEHTFIGDFRAAVVCPSGKRAILKYGNPSYDPDAPQGYPHGSGMDFGYIQSNNNGCDSLNNIFGDGLEYCWSRNEQYTLVTNEPCSVYDVLRRNGNNFDGTDYVDERHVNANQGKVLQYQDHVFDPGPAYFTSVRSATGSGSTRFPSNHAEKTDYYMPDADFSELIGCPLNGEWQFEVCDYWSGDNGWVFSWSLDICGISSSGCEYQVDIDSVIWTPDSAYGDFKLGHWRGATLWPKDSIRTWIGTPDTAGSFPLHVKIYDAFGCVWDTVTNLVTVWNPMPELPDTVIMCGVQTVTLDASDAHTAKSNQTYMWEPYGDTTATIISRPGAGGTGSTLYTVQVTNTQNGIRCSNRDSVRVNFFKQPVPNFDPGIYPLEGCEPFTLYFQNNSLFADNYHWVFGDGATSDAESPIHTYATGQYGFKFYVSSNDGCKDSLIYDNLITVFPSPQVKFSWEPVNPTVLHPEVHFINKTEPQTDAVKFYWEVQYDKDNPLSYHTMRELNPSFQWTTDGEDISGTYIARLIAKTDERGPSGNMLECRDTVENTILLVNDFLQFPSVVTANGDGINDVFVIKNLVNGLGYPQNSLAIYNRWGKRVYFKENISSEEDFWDPAKENIPAGTYFWRFSGKGYIGDIERNGTVEVLR